MKKSLLIAVAAFFVAVGANAQALRVAKQSREITPQAVEKKAKKLGMAPKATSALAEKPVLKAKGRRAAAGELAGIYILDTQNTSRDFTSSSEFSIEAAEGTVQVSDFDESEKFVLEGREFQYNVILHDFAVDGSQAYGYFDSEDNTLWIPMQKIAEDNDPEDPFGNIVLSTVSIEGTSASYGGDLLFSLSDDFNLEFISQSDGFCTFGPDGLSEYFFWNIALDPEVFWPNGVMGSRETHVVSGAWSDWTTTYHNVYIENYGTEIVVHNFFSICPVSITVSGNEYNIELPVYLGTYEYPTYGRMQIWREDENGTDDAPLTNEGKITGYAFTSDDGYPGIRFWDTEYREAWTDPDGTEHEAGNYYTYRPFFYMGAINATGYGYWWGESYGLSIYDLSVEPTGISEVNANAKNTTGKTYNVMGQQVGANAKGLIIRDGKKFVIK